MADRYELVIQFGKHKGRTIEEIPSDYLKWLEEDYKRQLRVRITQEFS